MGSCQRVAKFDFQSQFSMSKIIGIFLIFFHWRIWIKEHIFCNWLFLMTPIFKSLYFLKWCSSFDSSPLLQFSKFNNFLWVCWFLAKNLSNFVYQNADQQTSIVCQNFGLFARSLVFQARWAECAFIKVWIFFPYLLVSKVKKSWQTHIFLITVNCAQYFKKYVIPFPQ